MKFDDAGGVELPAVSARDMVPSDFMCRAFLIKNTFHFPRPSDNDTQKCGAKKSGKTF